MFELLTDKIFLQKSKIGWLNRMRIRLKNVNS
ncbi:MAG: hypothetical protein RL060_193 [Bacteroidota bacterium]|jgi:hypothetical protein